MDTFWAFYESMPTVTRSYITACVLTTLAVQLDIISPFQLYFNFNLIFYHHQYWRLLTTFLFFGTFSFTFFFNIVFTYRYSRMLEEGSFRSNSADFFFMLLFGAVLMTVIAPFVKLLFLGHAFTIMLVYVWAKRNTHLQLNLFGLFNFRAPHLPWILLGFSLILGNSVLTDIMGICVGHIYYYLQDVFPHLPGGKKILKTPKIIVYLFNPTEYYLNRLNREVNENITGVTENVNTPQVSENSLDESTTESSPVSSPINDPTISVDTNEENSMQNRTTHQSSLTKIDSSVSNNDQKPTTSNQHSHLD